MVKLKKLFESFSKQGNIYLNNSMEVCFEIEFYEIDWNWAKVNYNDIEGMNINTAPKNLTKKVKAIHHAFFKYVDDEQELNCKVLEWLSRPAFKEGNDIDRKWYLDGINKFLGTNFTREDIEEVYCYLGNNVNRELTLVFIKSGYDINVLKKEKTND